MNLERAIRLARVWAFGGVCSLKEGEAQEYHKLALAALEALRNGAVPVIRCGECKWWDADPDSYGKDDGPNGKCMKSFEETNDDDFCSYGERKDGDGNG